MVVTEASLRARLKGQKGQAVTLPAGAFLTPAAKQFVRDHGLTVVTDPAAGDATDHQAARPSPAPGRPGAGRPEAFRCQECGGVLTAKPEHYTHLHDNVLVPKTHPRIALRGKLDHLGAWLLDSQVLVRGAGYGQLADDLHQFHALVRELLKAEVTGEALPPLKLLGMDAEALRRESHARWLEVTPAHGPVPVRLNLLRTLVRETELAAHHAFSCGGETPERSDLLTALNRLSSAVYVLLLRFADGKYGPAKPGR